MNIKNFYQLSIFFFLLVCIQTIVTGVTDEELEALEHQIDQQEKIQKERKEAERKAREEAKRLAEDKKQLEEEKRKLEEERKRMEALRKVEIEKNQEEEIKRKDEEKKKDKYNLLLAEAEQAINDKDKKLAINKYNEVLTLAPNDPTAKLGIQQAEKLLDKICYKFIGKWEKANFIGSELIRVSEGGYIYFGVSDSNRANWTCYSDQSYIKDSQFNATFELNNDATCLYAIDWSGKECFAKVDNQP